MHSHHSHSGQYIQHAKDNLDDIVAEVCVKGFDVFCLTEHMPRYRSEDLYPEEIESNTTPVDLIMTFERYFQHATRIKEELNKKRAEEKKKQALENNADKKDEVLTPLILVGFECEGFSEAYIEHVQNLQKMHKFDMFVGSIHHVHGIPIDYDVQNLDKAAQISLTQLEALEAQDGKLTGPSNEDPKRKAYRALLRDYFDLQFRLIQQLTPPVIAHFDLIRLFAPKEYLPQLTSSSNLANYTQPGFLEREFPDVWEKIVRNVEYAVGYKALFEVNSAAVRKGWPTPYPASDIAKLIIEKGGRFCLSDDSHGIAQVGLNYPVSIKYLQDLGVESLYYLSLASDDDPEIPEIIDRTVTKSILVKDVATNRFFLQRTN